MKKTNPFILQQPGQSPALENGINKDNDQYEQGAQNRTNEHEDKLGCGRVVDCTLRPNHIKVEREEPGEIKHVQNYRWPRNVYEANRHKALHAVHEDLKRVSG
jgi:hypothetical protein